MISRRPRNLIRSGAYNFVQNTLFALNTPLADGFSLLGVAMTLEADFALLGATC